MKNGHDDQRAAAAALLSTAVDEILAWESAHWRRAVAALEQFATGALSEPALRAALGDGDRERGRPPVPKGSGVVVLPLVGILTPRDSFATWLGFGTNVTAFINQLSAATADPSVRSIVVLVDSPGGMVGMVPEAAAAMRAARARKPVIVSVAGMAASAAYWIASNGTRLEATPSATLGSIGVFAERVSLVRRLHQDGIDVAVVSAGKYKAEGHEAIAMSAAERAALQVRVDETNAVFVGDVAAGRRVSAATVTEQFGQGRVVSATTARAVGMIDRVATVDETFAAVVSPEAAATVAQQRRELAQASAAPLRAAQAQRTLAGMRTALALRAMRAQD